MSILAFGINHKTASVDIREKVAFDPDTLDGALQALLQIQGVGEAVILSTCNRTEIYCAGDEVIQDDALLGWLGQFHAVETAHLSSSIFSYRDRDAIAHVLRVAAGLDSLVLGEPQILGQLKSAYASALEAEAVNGHLGRLFEHSFSVAKRIRTETSIGENPVSVAAAAVNMARQLFADFSDNTALLIGAGKTTELVARHLRQAGIKHLIIANRTIARAQELADVVQGQAALLEAIPDLLFEADIVISSTAAPLPILGKGAVERALKQRKHRPFFMVDIAVPRDIEPQVGDLPDVFLYTVDDLKQVIDENLRSREDAAREAEELIQAGCEAFVSQLRVSTAGEVVKQFRAKAEALQALELDKAMAAIRAGGDVEVVMKNFSRALTNKLIHEPTVQVRKAAADGEYELGKHLLQLFGLEQDTLEQNKK